MNQRQQAITNAIQFESQGARGLVLMFEETLVNYWGKDSRSTDYLSFFLNAISHRPNLCSSLQKLMPCYAPVIISKLDGVFSIVNNKEASKACKARLQEEVAKLVDEKAPSIREIGKLAPDEPRLAEWNDNRKKALKRSAMNAISLGCTATELLELMHEAAKEQAEVEEQVKKHKEAAAYMQQEKDKRNAMAEQEEASAEAAFDASIVAEVEALTPSQTEAELKRLCNG